MILNLSRQILFQTLLILIIPVLLVNAQDARVRISVTSARPLAMNVAVPQARFMAAHPSALVRVTDVEVGVEIVEQVATTAMQINLTRLAEQNRQGCVALNGEILLRVDGETVLVK